jgi:hypothetical protein
MSKSKIEFEKGDKIIYVPTHANGDKNHPDCELGYVTSVNKNGVVFCRFFYPDGRLRTVANSEGCDPADLVKELGKLLDWPGLED